MASNNDPLSSSSDSESGSEFSSDSEPEPTPLANPKPKPLFSMPQPSSINPPPSTPLINPNAASAESEPEPEPTPVTNPKNKPVVSKPVKAQPQAQAQSTPVSTRTRTKRSVEVENNSRSSKKLKKTSVNDVSGSNGDENETDKVKMTGEGLKKNGKHNAGGGEKFVGEKTNETDKDDMILSEIIRFNDAAGSSSFNKDSLIRGLRLVNESKRVSMEEEWMEIKTAEMKVFAEHTNLISTKANWLLQALQKSSQ